MIRTKYLAPAALLSVGLVFAVGCDSGPRPVPVSGSVTVGGQPADHALVRLWPVEQDPDPDKLIRPLGYAQADGAFSLTTFSAGDGAPPGKYKVTVEWRPRPLSSMEPDGPDKLDGKYADPEKSTIEVTIEPGSNQLPPIALE